MTRRSERYVPSGLYLLAVMFDQIVTENKLAVSGGAYLFFVFDVDATSHTPPFLSYL